MDAERLEQELLEYLQREAYEGEPVTRTTELFDGGRIDSMGLVQLATFIERRTGIEIPDRDINADHFEDIAATRVHKHLIPGHGAIDFEATLQAIQRTSYDGWVTVELYPYIDNPDDAARQARTYLTAAMERVGIEVE